MRDGNTAEDGSPCPGGCLYSRPADRRDAFNKVTPRLELIRQLDTGHSLYAVLTEGFRPPEITELYRLQRNQSVADLDAETMRSAEIGWRFGRGEVLRGNLALYRARKANVILRDANGFNVIGGRTRHQGTEYELAWRPGASQSDNRVWQLSAGGSWARHRYDFSRAIDGGETIVAGRDIDTAPRAVHRVALTLQPRPAWSMEIEARYTGAYFADAANERRHPAQTVLALRGRWQAGSRLALTLEVDNLADSLLADRADFAQGDWRYFPARRRSAWLGVDWRSR
jgi:outer membrane receptor protein involved in Fe transport